MSRTRSRPAALLVFFVVSLLVVGVGALVSCGLESVGTAPELELADASPIEGASRADAEPDVADAASDRSFAEPDPNEPNDTTPTPIAVVEQDGGVRAGTQHGVIATPGDVDRFSFEVPAGTHVVYMRVTAPALVPPSNARLRYELHGPGLAAPVLASGEAKDDGAVDLGTARLVSAAQAGSFVLLVATVAPPGGVAPGDPRLAYDVDLRILPVDDVLEPNDSEATAVARQLAVPGASSTATLTGRVGWVTDEDWFRVELAASSEPTVLSYRLTPTGPGRFPRLPGPKGIRVRALTAVTASGTVEAQRTACKTSQSACPKGFDAAGPEWVSQVEALCDAPAGPRCLHAARIEHLPHGSLSNFRGAITIPPHGSKLSLWFVVDDTDSDGADDVPFALDVTWSPDPDEATRMNGGVESEVAFSLTADPGTTYPLPAPAAPAITGRLTYGFGAKGSLDPSSPDAVRGPDDYDAISSDEDVYLVQLPSVAPPEDRTWALSWSVDTEGSTTPAHDLAVDVTFCDGDLVGNGGQCTEVSTRGDGTPIRFTSPGVAVPWPQRPNGAPIAHFTQETTTSGALDAGTLVTTSTSTARAEACTCLEPRFVRGGHARLRVRAVDRRSYAPSTYSIRTSYLSYPRHASLPGAGGACGRRYPARLPFREVAAKRKWKREHAREHETPEMRETHEMRETREMREKMAAESEDGAGLRRAPSGWMRAPRVMSVTATHRTRRRPSHRRLL